MPLGEVIETLPCLIPSAPLPETKGARQSAMNGIARDIETSMT